MAIAIAKPVLSEMIDEYAALDAAVEKMKPHVARHKALRDELLAIATATTKDTEPAYALVVENERYVLQWTPQDRQTRIVSMAAVKKRLGLPLFISICSMTLKALGQHVTEAEQRLLGLIVTERTGPRSCSITPKLAPVVVEVC